MRIKIVINKTKIKMEKILEIAKERIVFCSTFLDALEKNKKENIEKNLNIPESDFKKKEIEFTEANNDWEKLLGYIKSNKTDNDFERVFKKTFLSMVSYHIKDNSWFVQHKEFSDQHPKHLEISKKTLDNLKQAFYESLEIWKNELNTIYFIQDEYKKVINKNK